MYDYAVAVCVNLSCVVNTVQELVVAFGNRGVKLVAHNPRCVVTFELHNNGDVVTQVILRE